MSSARDLVIRIRGDSAEFVAAVDGAGRQLADFGRHVESIDRSASATTASLARLGQGLTAFLGAREIINAADAYSEYASRMRMAVDSTLEFDQAQARMAASANNTFRSINETRESFILMSPVLRQMGLSLNESIDALDTFSGLLVVNAASSERAGQAQAALAKSLQTGRVDAMAWQSLLQSMPSIVTALADSTGEAEAEIRRLGISGQLSAQMLADALVAANAEVLRQVEGMPTTVGDALTRLNNSFGEWIGKTNESMGATNLMVSAIGLLGKHFDTLANAALVAGTALGANYVRSLLAAAAQKRALAIAEAQHQVALARTNVLQTQATMNSTALAAARQRELVATNALAAAQSRLAGAAGLARSAVGMLGGPIGIATTLLSAGVTAWLMWGNSAEDAAKKARAAADDHIQSVIDKLAVFDSAIEGMSRKAADAMLKSGTDALQQLQAEIEKEASRLRTLQAGLSVARDYGFSGRSIRNKEGELSAAQERYQGLLKQEIELQGKVAAARDQTGRAGIQAIKDFTDANAVGAARVARERAKLQEEFDRIMKDAGGYNASNPEHVKALDALNGKLAELEKSGRKGATGLRATGDAAAEAAKQAEAAAKAMQSWIVGLAAASERDLSGITATTDSLREQLETLGMSTDELVRYRAEKLDTAAAAEQHAAAELEAAAALLKAQGILPEVAASYRNLARARRDAAAQLSDQAQLTRALAEKQGNIDAARAAEDNARHAADEWQRTADSIEDALVNALMDGGKSGREYLEGLFRNLVLRPVIQAVAQPLTSVLMSGMMGGAMGGGNAAAGTANGFAGLTGGSNGGFNTTQLAQMSSLFNTGSGAAMGTEFIANAWGSMGGDSVEALIAANSANWGVSSSMASNVASGLGYVSALYDFSQGNYGAAVGAAIGTYILPGIGTLIGQMLGGLVDGMMGGGTPHKGAVVMSDGTSTRSPTTIAEIQGLYANALDAGQFMESDFTKRRQEGMADALTPIAEAHAQQFNALAAAMGAGGQYSVGLGFSADGDSKSRGRFSVIDDAGNELADFSRKFARQASEGMTQFVSALGPGLRDALIAAAPDMAQWQVDALKGLQGDFDVDALTLAVEQIKGIESASEALGVTMGRTAEEVRAMADSESLAGMAAQIGALSVAVESAVQLGLNLDPLADGAMNAAMGLAGMAGGLEQFAAMQGAVNAMLLPAASQAEQGQKQLAAAFAKAGVEVPKTASAYRNLLRAQDLLTESGRKTYVQLIQLAPAFDAARAELLSLAGLAGGDLKQLIMDGLTGDKTADELATALNETVMNGIWRAMADNTANTVTDLMIGGIINPAIQAMVLGNDIAQALSKQHVDDVIAQIGAQVQAFNAVMSSPEIQALFAEAGQALSGISGVVSGAANSNYYRSSASGSASVQQQTRAAADGVVDAWREVLARIKKETLDAGLELSKLGMSEIERATADVYEHATQMMAELRAAGMDDAYHTRRGQLEAAIARIEGYKFQMHKDRDADLLAQYREELEGMVKPVAGLNDEVQAWVDSQLKLLHAQREHASWEELRAVRFDAELEYLRATGRAEEALAREREKAIEGLTDEQVAYYDATQSMYRYLESLTRIKDGAASLASDVASAFNYRNTAGSLIDQIDAAKGGAGNGFAGQREAELWSAITTATYEQQIDMAGELLGLIDKRSRVEQQQANAQLAAAQRLKDYVDGLLTGNLSPLTLGEKLAEAGQQYSDTLAAAQGGDTDALNKLQGVSSTFLDLARQYHASSNEYAGIFERVTGALSELGASSMSEAQQQLNATRAGTAALDKLQGIMLAAYNSADEAYLHQAEALQSQLYLLSAMTGGIDQVAEILGQLPAELAAIFGHVAPADDGSLAGYVRALYQTVLGREAEEAGLAYWMEAFATGSADAASFIIASQEELTRRNEAAYTGLPGELQSGLERALQGFTSPGSAPLQTINVAPFDFTPFRQGNDALVAEVRALREEVAQLRAERNRGDQMNVEVTMNASHNNAATVVAGVGSAIDRATYQTTIRNRAQYV